MENNSTSSTPFASIRDSASNLFTNVSSSVQGYLPLNSGEEEEEESWYQLSRVERVIAFALCLGLGILCFFLAFTLFLFLIPIAPGKFAATFTLGSILLLVSIAMLRGPWAHIKHMVTVERLPFTISYLGSMALTLYASLGVSRQNKDGVIHFCTCFDLNRATYTVSYFLFFTVIYNSLG
ncbi:unnamed protein product [Absidia cylindrospora]